MIQGKAGIETFWAARFERMSAVTLTTVDVISLGDDAAREVGTSLVTLKGVRANCRQVHGGLAADRW